MARNIGADGATVYRAVIRFEWPDRDAWTKHEGPYDTAGQAKARVTFWTNYRAETDPDCTTTGHVEQAHTVWAPIGEQPAPNPAARAFIDNDDTCDCGGCDTCQPRAYAAELRARADCVERGEQP
jgi:hypothetical protein